MIPSQTLPPDAESAAFDAKDTARYHVPNLERALLVMEFLAAEPQGCGLSEIAKRLDLPKNSVFRIVSTLHAHGYLRRDPADKTYRLSQKLLTLGHAAVDELHLVEKSIDLLRELRDETDETVLLGKLIDGQGIALEQVPSNQSIKFLVNIGHRYPLHTAAPGKAIMAFLPAADREALLGRMTFTRFNERTITTRAAFEVELEEVRRTGYALDRAEQVDGIHCVAAPIFNHRGQVVAAVWAVGPCFRLQEQDFPGVARSVIASARRISERLGHSPR